MWGEGWSRNTSVGFSQLSLRNNEERFLFNYLLGTPSFSFYYKNAFHLQSGALLNITAADGSSIMNPFVSASVDVIRLLQPESGHSWKVFGSMAQGKELAEPIFYLSDFALGNRQNYPLLSTGNILHLSNDYKFKDQHIAYQAGTVVSLLKEKLSFSYNYLRNNNDFIGKMYFYPIAGGYLRYFSEVPLTEVFETHRMGIRLNLPIKTEISWMSQLNAATTLPSRDDMFSTIKARSLGWVNRIHYKKAFLGLDMGGRFFKQEAQGWPYPDSQTDAILKRWGGDPTSMPRAIEGNNNISQPTVPEKSYHEIALHNLYMGYQLRLAKQFPLEVYLNARNLVVSKNLPYAQNRMFVGGGFNVGF